MAGAAVTEFGVRKSWRGKLIVIVEDEQGNRRDAKDADLSGFRNRGGKLLMTYGWADAVLQPMMGVNYYQNATAVNGPSTPDFFRLFMIPGMAHCSGGIGPDRHDPVTAIINWVEKGQAPDTIIASRSVPGPFSTSQWAPSASRHAPPNGLRRPHAKT